MFNSKTGWRWLSLAVSLTVCHGLMAQTGSISGKVTSVNGDPLPQTKVSILSLKRITKTDDEGQYQFSPVPTGTFQIQVSTSNWGNQLHEVTVNDGQDTEANFDFDVRIHEDLTVSATAQRKSISDVAQAIDVLNEQDLFEKTGTTIGGTLEKEPGIHSTYFGPGAGRPVIRGLSGDRIRVLEGGLGTGDASTVSADHAVSTDMLTTERVEVLRGPATLRYGSNAVGGAVNIIDNRIPEFLPDSPLEGEVGLRFNTVADERSGAASLNGSVGSLAWHADYADRDTGDYEIPGHPELEPEVGEEESGILENSSLTSKKGAVGLSFIKNRGFLGLSVTRFESNYGIPGHGHEHEKGKDGEEEEPAVRIDLEQQRLDLRGSLNLDAGPWQSLNLRYGQADYEHLELEGAETGTRFDNDAREARLEAVHLNWGPFTSGSFGVHYRDRDFQALGEEAFVPPNQTKQYAAFVYEEFEKETWNFSAGLRVERQETDGEFLEHGHAGEGEGQEENEGERINRDFSGLSGSLGFVFFKEKPLGLAINLTHTDRAPTPEELFSNGPHLATDSFEVGNPELNEEKSLGANISLRRTRGLVTGEVNLFTNQFSDFIYQASTGEEEDGLEEFVYRQQDADFYGGELHLDTTLWHTEPHHLHLELTADFVRAELDNGEDLPRISPNRYRADLEYQQSQFWIKTSVTRTASQNRLAPGETATAGYTILDASAGYRFFAGGVSHELLATGTNLGDEVGRVHTSFLKDRIILPGRNFTLAYRLRF